ncbi:hypothetical protein M8818_005346 [Zalaria obscura]|uniref:Uncharacterized protein n=1 Tax=Zalaria obscura TaxID=2024903 RepID=A0ACC3SDG2_9PEZI
MEEDIVQESSSNSSTHDEVARDVPPAVNGVRGENQDQGDDYSDRGSHDSEDEDDDIDREDDGGDRPGYDRILDFYPFREDTSTPHEGEIRMLEQSPEHSALKDLYWKQQAFFDVEDPDIRPQETGQIEWSTEKFNGTLDNPTRERVMTSETVRIGGYDWQLKILPRGNGATDRVSVYVENLSIRNMPDVEWPEKDLPIPSLSSQYETTRKVMQQPSVSAQIGVIMYNPAEPRVHEFKADAHRFTRKSPDHGWTRFTNVSWYELHRRSPMQRQPLLRNDRLCVKAYVRIINDPTCCMWSHEDRYEMAGNLGYTGLLPFPFPGAIGAVLQLWLHASPLREVLYQAKGTPQDRSSPLATMQKLLFYMRARPKVDQSWVYNQLSSAMVSLRRRQPPLRSTDDVIQTMDVLMTALEEELGCKPFRSLFGSDQPFSGKRATRLTIGSHASIQSMVDAASSGFPSQAKLLTIDLERQIFDDKKRHYKKLRDKVEINDEVTVNGVKFLLYGIVTHKGYLSSDTYQAYVRPQHKGLWYRHDNTQVTRLTRKSAVSRHEGSSTLRPLEEPVWGEGRAGRCPPYAPPGDKAVAYVALYINSTVGPINEAWNVPQWILDHFKSEVQPLRPLRDSDILMTDAPVALVDPLGLGTVQVQTAEVGFVPTPATVLDILLDGPSGVDNRDGPPAPVPTYLLEREAAEAMVSLTSAGGIPQLAEPIAKEMVNESSQTGAQGEKHNHAAPKTTEEPEQVTINYFTQPNYSGTMLKGAYHGTGHLIYLNGDEYTGSFQHSQRSGHGSQTYQNGDTYKGEWSHDLQHGQGTYTEIKTGNSYTGGWVEGKKHGRGITYWKVSEEEKKLCQICCEREMDAAFYDCGHVVACRECARQVHDCPVCRRRVRDVVKLYYMA